MPFFNQGNVNLYYEDTGLKSGATLLLIPGGGLNSKISYFNDRSPFNPINEFKSKFRCISMDLRNANNGKSTGPLDIENPWDSHTHDQLNLMNHLNIKKFSVMGFCIGGPLIWNLLKFASNRIDAAVIVQPSGYRAEHPDLFYNNNITGWGPTLCKDNPEITPSMVANYLTKMYKNNPDFVFTVTRDFVRSCQKPILILPDDVLSHPYQVAMETAYIAPQSEVSIFPWKDSNLRIALAVRQIHSFLRAHVLTRSS
jgi:pimeloyl-ACP methyl ester carboxylesterase